MKLTPMTCPACGAVLHLDPESGMAHCSHCGTLYVLDDERKRVSIEDGYDFGYDFERGRMKAQGEDGSRPKPTDAKGANGGGRSQDKGQRTSVAADSAVRGRL